MYIDRNEIEEILGEYYDFSDWKEEDWERASEAIEKEVERRGIHVEESAEEYDRYCAVCDGVVGRIMSSK